MRVLVTGANGHIGKQLCPRLKEAGLEVVGADISSQSRPNADRFPVVPLDVVSPTSVEATIKFVRPDTIVHLAGIKDVAKCEANPAMVQEVNGFGTELVAKSAARYGVFLVYISTDYVFDGRRGKYRETDPANPSTVYGRSKLLGERFAIQATQGKEVAIVRTAAVYGIQSCFPWVVLDHLRHGRPMDVFKDIYNTPTSISLLTRGLLRILESKQVGLFHIAGPSRLSRFEWARRVADTFGGGGDLLRPVEYDPEPEKLVRPRDLSLSCHRARVELGLSLDETDEDRLLLAWEEDGTHARSHARGL